MIVGKVGNTLVNCFDEKYHESQLKQWAKKKIILCPVCNKPYEYCHGKVKTPYFRHMDKNECDSIYSEPETEEHLNGKYDLYRWLLSQNDISDIKLEAWVPETKQRPDIMFNFNGIKCVIEYQCSPISSEYLERHELYKMMNINDIWICGTKKYFGLTKRMNTLEKLTDFYYDPQQHSFYHRRKLCNGAFELLQNTIEATSDQEIIMYKNELCKKYKINLMGEYKENLLNYFYAKKIDLSKKQNNSFLRYIPLNNISIKSLL